MKRTPVLILTILVLATAAAAVLYFTRQQATEPAAPAPVTNSAPAAETYSELPDLSLQMADGRQVLANTLPGKTVLILFRPDCDHCQREAEAIHQHLNNFQGYQLYFISEMALPDIVRFAQEYQLLGQPNVHFAQATVSDLLRNFGSFSLPAIHIYDQNRQRKASFSGETPIGAILEKL